MNASHHLQGRRSHRVNVKSHSGYGHILLVNGLHAAYPIHHSKNQREHKGDNPGQEALEHHYKEGPLHPQLPFDGGYSRYTWSIEDAERKGIGTPATRAATIEKLVQKGYLERKGKGKMKYLIPTQIGQALITVAPEQIQSPSMTADCEEKLSQIEHGQYTPEQFMGEIAHMITDLVNTYEIVEGAEALMRRNQNIGICPHCGSEVIAREKGWMCRNRECRFALWKNSAYFKKIGKPMTEHMAARLIREKRLRLKDCQSQRTGRVFTADVLMNTEADGSPTFTMTFPNGGTKK